MAEIQSDSQREIINYLFDRTKKLAQHTRLLHINKAIMGNNGTNGHSSTADAESGIKTISAKCRLPQLLKLFKNSNGLWAVNDPGNKQMQNFIAFKKLLMSADRCDPLPTVSGKHGKGHEPGKNNIWSIRKTAGRLI